MTFHFKFPKYFLLLISCLVFVSQPCLASFSAIPNPSIIKDSHGNSANGQSIITWAPLPDGEPYKTNLAVLLAFAKGLDVYFTMVTNFVKLIFTNGIPYDFIKKIMLEGIPSSLDDIPITEIVQFLVGYVACLGFGILFFIIFPVVGFFFCCCRCCGNCGGKMEQKKPNECKRITCSILLLVFLLVIGSLAACIFVANAEVTRSMGTTTETVSSNIIDLETYLKNTIKEIYFIAWDGFLFTWRVVLRDLENIGILIGSEIQIVFEDAGLKTVLSAASDLGNGVTQLASRMRDLDRSLQFFKDNYTALDNALLNAGKDIVAHTAISLSCSSLELTCLPVANCTVICNTGNNLSPGMDSSKFPDISSQLAEVDKVDSMNLTKEIGKASKMLDDIPQNITEMTKGLLADVNTTLDGFTSTINTTLGQIEGFLGQGNDSVLGPSIGSLKILNSEIQEMLSSYKPFSEYANYGITGLLGLIFLLFFMGLTLGCCAYRKTVPTTRRNLVGHCGGQCLMAATGFTFIFGPILMLVTTVLFIPGALLEGFVCQTVGDLDSSFYSSFLINLKPLVGDEVGDILFRNNSNFTIATALKQCETNAGIFKAFELADLNIIDLSILKDYKKQINVTEMVDKQKIDLGNLDIFPSSLKTDLKKLQDNINLNFTEYKSSLAFDHSKLDLTEIEKQLIALSTTSSPPTKTDLRNDATVINAINSTELQAFLKALELTRTSLDNLEASIINLPTLINNTIEHGDIAQKYITANSTITVKKVITMYINRIISIIDSFINRTLKLLLQDVGGCKPVHTLFTSVINVVLCRNVVSSLNGIWFGLGGFVFLCVPSLIMAVHLAKFFRKMKYGEIENPYIRNASPGLGTNNRVGIAHTTF